MKIGITGVGGAVEGGKEERGEKGSDPLDRTRGHAL